MKRASKVPLLSIPLFLLLACGEGASPIADNADAGPAGGTGGVSSQPSTNGGSSNPPTTTAADGSSTSAGGSASQTVTGTGAGGTNAEPTTPEEADLRTKLAEVAGLDAAGFAARTQVAFEALDYDPSEATGLASIQSSELGMTEAELAKFDENGFVISKRQTFPHFSYGYASIYADDLPLYITADSILYAMHTAYDAILKSFEGAILIREVTSMLDRMRDQLAASDLADDVKRDLDIFLTLASSLNAGELQTPLLADSTETVTSIYEACLAATGTQTIELFGSQREVDFSQFKPRGHYTDSEALMRYFRAMIWMGRTDFRLLEPQDGELVLNRRQAEAVVALRTLMDEEAQAAHQSVDAIVTAFVGEHDSMTAPQVDALMADVGMTSFAELGAVSDAALKDAIVLGGYGKQRISSQIMVGGLDGETTPLPASFALFGQRYVIDSHVFSNVVFDRVLLSGAQRMLPNPLDVAYAALQNDHAGMLLEPELETYDYASDLASMRTLVDSESSDVWGMNLYNRWLDALRSLSPAQAWSKDEAETLPQVAKTEAWGRRLLNTQLASWAELRHDTMLYAKQSYTSGSTCEYPDAYVDPYPEFFEKVRAFASHALDVMAEHGFTVDEDTVDYDLDDPESLAQLALLKAQQVLAKFVEVAGILAEMAEHQRTGTPHSEAHMEFVNQTVAIQQGCGSPVGASGWYAELFVDSPIEWAPTIADVHTQPTDETGSPVGRVLHVGTGDIQMMVTSVNTCSGPRAYVGLVSSYFERIESDFTRLNDIEWGEILRSEAAPASPPWVTSLMAE